MFHHSRSTLQFFVNLVFAIFVCITAFFLYSHLFPKIKTGYVPKQVVSKHVKLKTVKVVPLSLSGKIKLPEIGALLGVSLYERNFDMLQLLENTLGKQFAIVSIYQAW